MIKRSVLIVLLSVSLAACGFNLRGSQQFGSELVGQLYLEEQGNISVLQPLRKALTAQQVRFAAVRGDADTIVVLGNEVISRRVASVSSSGRVSEYELLHAVDLQTIRAVDGVRAGQLEITSDNQPKEKTVSVARDYTYDETDVLAKDDEERILRDEMADELVRHLVLVIFSGLR
ncbi:MAG: LPS assembly lipoprotein LptE [Pseudomonadota bacterium]